MPKNTKKAVKKIIILILIPILIFAIVQGLMKAEDFFYHQNIPDPKDIPYDWLYPIVTAFSVPEEGCALFVDLDLHIMTVYIDGKIHKIYPVSGGKASTPSPVGTWKVVGKSDWGEGFGGSWIAINVPWGKYGIHGTMMPWAVGNNNISKGCIRMKNTDVKEVKRLVKWGTIVHIKHDSLPFRAMKNGKVGSDVLNVELMLQNLKYYNGILDGKFGDGLEIAVKNFQKENRSQPTE